MADEYIPRATYRMQFHRDFRFSHAQQQVEYLHRLGISDIYASPILRSRPGSMHGYDVVDYSVVNREIGGEDELKQLSTELSKHGMGLVVDVVPNHMGVMDERNRWWWDVLENGPSSPFASYFDIDWKPPKQELHNRVLIPVLGDQFGRVLDNQELRLDFSEGILSLYYYDKHFPLDPRTWLLVLEPAHKKVREQQYVAADHVLELESIITALNHLPRRSETAPEKVEERLREKEIVKRRLATLVSASAFIRDSINEVVTEMNGVKGETASFDNLAHLISDQAYRLSFWRVAADEINYRRFFDVNELAAIRVELPAVFKDVHQTIFRLISEKQIRGLRIDHPDGLFNPRQYFADLQKACHNAANSEAIDTAMFPASDTDCGFWIVVEKILGRNEKLRADWAVHGTTGYDYLNLLNGIFVNGANSRDILKVYQKYTGHAAQFTILMYQCKKLLLDASMSGERHVLARRLDRISEQHRWTRDFTLFSLQEALAEVIACFPVYRSYLRPEDSSPDEEDRRNIVAAIRAARKRNPAISASIYDFIQSVLLLEHPEGLTDQQIASRKDFVLRFQQMTGPVMAKGLEDTAFYREFPLSSLNEVGGEPERFGVSLEEFHKVNAERLKEHPHSLLATSTHDTKRSEDVRARINVISEIPDEWGTAISRWRTYNKNKKQQIDGIHVPSTNEGYLLYQTIVGAWALDEQSPEEFRDRIKAYMIKASREAKVHTSWINVNEAHEKALLEFVDSLFNPAESKKFLADIQAFRDRIAPAGAVNSLSQVVLKATSPGIPDFYQGEELWNFSLVDPDNRRPVDFEKRSRIAQELESKLSENSAHSSLCHELMKDWVNGHIKLYTTMQLLRFRREFASLFEKGSYTPLFAEGPMEEHICAFARNEGDTWMIVVVPRLIVSYLGSKSLLIPPGKWNDTFLLIPEQAPVEWRDILTGRQRPAKAVGRSRELDLRDVFADFPVAVLTNAHETS